MDQHDMGGVPVARRAEVRRRIGLIEDFLALSAPTPAQRLQLRNALGVSRPMLYVLLGAWRRDRDPSALPGAFAPRAASRLALTRKVGAEPLILASLAAIGPEASGADFMRDLAARCAEAGVERPSKSYLLRRLREDRAAAPVAFADRQLLYIDFCAVDAGPAARGCGNPVVAAAIQLPERAIVAHEVVWRVPTAADAAALLATAIGRGTDRPIALARLGGLGDDVMRAILAEEHLLADDDPFAPSRRFRPAAGERLGTLRLHPGRTTRERSDAPPPGDVVEAVAAVVAEAVEEHGRRHPAAEHRGGRPADPARTTRLLRWLGTMPA